MVVQCVGNKKEKITKSQKKLLIDKIQKRLKKVFYCSDFDNPAKISEIIAPMPGEDVWLEKSQKIRSQFQHADAHEHMRVCYESELLSREQEYHLFRVYNYYKYRAKLDLDNGKFKSAVKNMKLADVIGKRITSANVRLAINLVKRYKGHRQYEDLVSESYFLVLRVVDFFDFTRGFKFSTYATWAVVRSLSRTVKTWRQQDARFQTTSEEFGFEIEATNTEVQLNFESKQNRELVMRLLDFCDEREKQVLKLRFFKNKTLLEISQIFNLSKERIRQIETHALAKICRKSKEAGVNPEDI
jgi:RNA polymerase primary sigma factor